MTDIFVASMFKYIGGLGVVLSLLLGGGLVTYVMLYFHNGDKTNEMLFTNTDKNEKQK